MWVEFQSFGSLASKSIHLLVEGQIGTTIGWLAVASIYSLIRAFGISPRQWRQSMTTEWTKPNVRHASYFMVASVFLLFSWGVVQTVYKDHVDSREKQAALRKSLREKDSELSTKDALLGQEADLVASLRNELSKERAVAELRIGKESVVIGKIAPNTKVGDRSVVMGATDDKGNAVYTQPGAYGYGAKAGPGSMAIGAHAGANASSAKKDSAPPLQK